MTKAAYVVLGITMDGRKDILGVWIGFQTSAMLFERCLCETAKKYFIFCTLPLAFFRAIEFIVKIRYTISK